MGTRRSSRRQGSGDPSASSSSGAAPADPFQFSNSNNNNNSSSSSSSPPANSSSSSSSAPSAPSTAPQYLHSVNNFILTPLTPGIPLDLRSRTQAQLDQLSSDVLLYALQRQSSLLPLRLPDVARLLKGAARGVPSVVLKDVKRRLHSLTSFRLSDFKPRPPPPSSQPASSRRALRPSAQPKAAPPPDAFLLTLDPSTLPPPPADPTTHPPASLATRRAHLALLKVVLDCVTWHHPDGVCAESALLAYLAPLLGVEAEKVRHMTLHVLFGSVMTLLDQWVAQGYLERVKAGELDMTDMGMYGADTQDSEQLHYRVGMRAKLEMAVERRYQFNMEHVLDQAHTSEEVMDRLRKKEWGSTGPGEGKTGEEKKAEGKAGGAEEAKEEKEAAFSLTQPASASRRRSDEPILLPQDQQGQLLTPPHQAMLRYLLQFPAVEEKRLLAFYRLVKEDRNPPLEPLFTALNAALNWTALYVQRLPCEYSGEGMWLLVDRSQLDAHDFFSAYRVEEISLLRALITELRRKEAAEGHAKLTIAQASRVARTLTAEEEVKGERRKRLLDGLHPLLTRLAREGWLYRHEVGGSFSVGMRGYAELCKAGVGTAAASPPTCPVCKHPVWYGEWCGRHQEVDEGCRVKYHQHCVRKVRQRVAQMKCPQGHVWTREKKTVDEMEEEKRREQGIVVEDGGEEEEEMKEEGGDDGEGLGGGAEEEEGRERGRRMPSRAAKGRKRVVEEVDEGEEDEDDEAPPSRRRRGGRRR